MLVSQRKNQHCKVVVGEPLGKPTGLIVNPENNHCKVVVGEPLGKPTGLDCEPVKTIGWF